MADEGVLELTRALIARASVTPEDGGCCQVIAERLAAQGFAIEWLDRNGVTNLWARLGNTAPLIVLAGHTDVVPPGPLEQWTSDPFAPSLREGRLYGRGAADMKSGLAAMVCAVEDAIAQRGPPSGSIAFLVTSDEEGAAIDGTRHVVEVLRDRGLRPDYAVVGEASSAQRLGDRIVIGRRGSLGCDLTVHGIQGHVAYPQRADNPIHRAIAGLNELLAQSWDDPGESPFPPTSLQISNFTAGTGANNVIPGSAQIIFNFRYSTLTSAAALRSRCEEILNRHLPRTEMRWWHSGEPFLTHRGRLIEVARSVVHSTLGVDAELFTGGGTSDARFLAPLGGEVIELGPVGTSIHQVNEHILIEDLPRLSALYRDLLAHLVWS